MDLGNFSLSLNVKNIKASKDFYEKLGFKEVGGNIDENWLVLKNGETKIGLFQGIFEKNMLTFNPGWNSDAQELKDFADIRELQNKLKQAGITIEQEIDPESKKGPAHFSLTDPDGNPILIDQHR